MLTNEVLERAADLMETKGWVQGIDMSPNGYCMRGAIFGACNALDEDGRLINSPTANRAQMELDALMGCSMMSWNDSVCTSQQQAVRVLRQASAALTPQFSELLKTEAQKEVRKLVVDPTYVHRHKLVTA